jgi:hypothetical protein
VVNVISLTRPARKSGDGRMCDDDLGQMAAPSLIPPFRRCEGGERMGIASAIPTLEESGTRGAQSVRAAW